MIIKLIKLSHRACDLGRSEPSVSRDVLIFRSWESDIRENCLPGLRSVIAEDHERDRWQRLALSGGRLGSPYSYGEKIGSSESGV